MIIHFLIHLFVHLFVLIVTVTWKAVDESNKTKSKFQTRPRISNNHVTDVFRDCLRRQPSLNE